MKVEVSVDVDVSDTGGWGGHLHSKEFLKLLASLLDTGAADVNVFAFDFRVMYTLQGQPYFTADEGVVCVAVWLWKLRV